MLAHSNMSRDRPAQYQIVVRGELSVRPLCRRFPELTLQPEAGYTYMRRWQREQHPR